MFYIPKMTSLNYFILYSFPVFLTHLFYFVMPEDEQKIFYFQFEDVHYSYSTVVV